MTAATPASAAAKLGGQPVKLVRDYTDRQLGGAGTISYRPAGGAEHIVLLRRKLVEQAAAYLLDASEDALAELLAVVWALARVDLQVAPKAIEALMVAKLSERGGYEAGQVMVAHHPADDRGPFPTDGGGEAATE
jgi:predicted house-cleaning noncanonical NTP pyrophosphatase (MazG superfamily)